MMGCKIFKNIYMSTDILKAIESLGAQNENGQFDQVIESLRVQFHKALVEEKKNEEAYKYGLTIEQYDEVIDAFENDDNPLDGYYEFTNDQMKLLAHKWTSSNNDLLFINDDEIVTFDEASDYLCDHPDWFFDIDEAVYNNYKSVDEDTLYQRLLDARNEVCETDENGELVLEKSL
jgi:hypothetical protein